MKFSMILKMKNGDWLHELDNKIGLNLINKFKIPEGELINMKDFISSSHKSMLEVDLTLEEVSILSIEFPEFLVNNEVSFELNNPLSKDLFNIKLEKYSDGTPDNFYYEINKFSLIHDLVTGKIV